MHLVCWELLALRDKADFMKLNRKQLEAIEELLDQASLNNELDIYQLSRSWKQLAEAYMKNGVRTDALRCYEKAFDLHFDESLVPVITMFYESLNQLEKAHTFFNRHVGNNPQTISELLASAELDYRAEKYDQAIIKLKSILTNHHGHSVSQISACYMLARSYNQTDQWSEAWIAVTQANQLVRQRQNIRNSELKEESQIFKQTIDEAHRMYLTMPNSHFDIAKSKVNCLRARQYAIIAGMPRSGTTLMAQILDANRNIAVAEETAEFNKIYNDYLIFEPDGLRGNIWRLDEKEQGKLTADYLNKLQLAVPSQLSKNTQDVRVLVDKNPLHMAYLDLIGKFLPNSKVILMIRDPRDVVLSCFFQRFSPNKATYNFLDLDDAVQFYISLMRLYLEVRKKFNLDILEVRYEDLVVDVEKQTRRISRFLAVPWEQSMIDFSSHAVSKEIKTPSYRQVSKPIYQTSAGHWINYYAELKPVLGLLEPYVEELGYLSTEEAIQIYSRD